MLREFASTVGRRRTRTATTPTGVASSSNNTTAAARRSSTNSSEDVPPPPPLPPPLAPPRNYSSDLVHNEGPDTVHNTSDSMIVPPQQIVMDAEVFNSTQEQLSKANENEQKLKEQIDELRRELNQAKLLGLQHHKVVENNAAPPPPHPPQNNRNTRTTASQQHTNNTHGEEQEEKNVPVFEDILGEQQPDDFTEINLNSTHQQPPATNNPFGPTVADPPLVSSSPSSPPGLSLRRSNTTNNGRGDHLHHHCHHQDGGNRPATVQHQEQEVEPGRLSSIDDPFEDEFKDGLPFYIYQAIFFPLFAPMLMWFLCGFVVPNLFDDVKYVYWN